MENNFGQVGGSEATTQYVADAAVDGLLLPHLLGQLGVLLLVFWEDLLLCGLF